MGWKTHPQLRIRIVCDYQKTKTIGVLWIESFCPRGHSCHSGPRSDSNIFAPIMGLILLEGQMQVAPFDLSDLPSEFPSDAGFPPSSFFPQPLFLHARWVETRMKSKSWMLSRRILNTGQKSLRGPSTSFLTSPALSVAASCCEPFR